MLQAGYLEAPDTFSSLERDWAGVTRRDFTALQQLNTPQLEETDPLCQSVARQTTRYLSPVLLKSLQNNEYGSVRRPTRRSRRLSEEFVCKRNGLLMHPEPEEPAVVVQFIPKNPDGTGFLLQNMFPLTRLHTLVLSVIAEEVTKQIQSSQSPQLNTRRRSCESTECSGKNRGKASKLHHVLTDKNTVSTYFLQDVPARLRKDSRQFDREYDFTTRIPWYLDAKPQRLQHNLQELLAVLEN